MTHRGLNLAEGEILANSALDRNAQILQPCHVALHDAGADFQPPRELGTRHFLTGLQEFQPSQHPLAEAIVKGTAERGVALSSAEGFQSFPGLSVQAKMDGRTVLIGNSKLMEREKIELSTLSSQAEHLASDGKTAMYAAADGRALGVVAVSDRVRGSARQAVDELRRLGVQTVMLTGDNRRMAEAVARTLGMDTVIADVLPGEKAAQVQVLQNQGRKVAMVGDGVNDAPALAQADMGVAIGAGTDVAVETADVVLVRSDPAGVAVGIARARKVQRKVKQNLIWAAIYNVLAIPIAAGVLYPAYNLLLRPEWAALLMSASGLCCLNRIGVG